MKKYMSKYQNRCYTRLLTTALLGTLSFETAALAIGSQWDRSILDDLDQASVDQGASYIDYPVCIYSEDASYSISSSKEEEWRSVFEDQVNIWNDQLEGTTGWNVNYINLTLVGSSTNCPTQDQGLKVLRIRRLSSSNANGSSAERYAASVRINVISSTFDASASASSALKVSLHEYGHLIGLDDTYTSNRTLSPLSRMAKGKYLPHGALTDDDVAAMTHIWELVDGQTTASCPSTYEEIDDGTGNTYCLPLLYKITNIGEGRDQCIGNISNTGGTWFPILAANCSNSSGKKYMILPGDYPDHYKITNANNSNECWRSYGDGTVEFAPCSNGDNRQWYFVFDSDDRTYKIKNKSKSGCLKVRENDNNKLVLQKCGSLSEGQKKWRLWSYDDDPSSFGVEANFPN